ncbi:MAG TPA: antibiotic biosynthesis monooxygenase [Acidimicrobiia bacterium]|nr:antibiotic biosynthesis monooxygenase [Acidimicrobiia bacterium]HZQ76971.1 antibiotic biosynthesis monooxygenase [Acidimicrobiia bacterium]
MMTVITRVSLREGTEPEWDEAMRERLGAARDQPGWVGGQMLIPLEGLNQRIIVGTWMTRADWEAWHDDPAFQETRNRMEELQAQPDEMEWFEVAIEAREASGV